MKVLEKDNISIYKRLIKSKIFFIFLVPVSIALIIGIFQNFYHRYQVKKDLDRLNAEVMSLNKQKEDLDNLLDYYKNSSNLEKEARVRLNYKKEGEKVVVILPTAATSSSNETISASSLSDTNLPNYRQWWYYFFGK
ncbi:MAG: septum formation initiator family protein [Candidatus Azambacteria bacterium]|nr:septum formation initiator family protein [Candidatus Azambacteria bacterium]